MTAKKIESQLMAFRPKARIMKTLGEELISSDSVAIIELVKNSYDADANDVLIKFNGPLEKGHGSIEVIDNGIGMDIDVIRNTWMEPATATKVTKKNNDSGRRVLGEKGIGRFAVARLAFKTEVSSKKSDTQFEAHGYVDWSQFDDDDKYLDQVEILTETRIPKEICKDGAINKIPMSLTSGDEYQGTVLKLIDLKQTWAESNFEDLQRGLSRLISPFSELNDFNIKIIAPEGFEKYSSEITSPEAIKLPHYTVSGEINSNGDYSVTYTVEGMGYKQIDKGQFISTQSGWAMIDQETQNKATSLRNPECGPLKIELRIWDRDDLGNIMQMTNSTLSSVRKDLDAYAGINIYRDGFRVLPYGEPNNDWLRLDIRRVQNPSLRLSNNQIFGYIAITADDNQNLKDQSNREGLRENQALTDLKEILMGVLSKIEVIRKTARKKEDVPPKDGENKKKVRSLFAKPDFDSLSSHLKDKHPGDEIAQNLITQVEKEVGQQFADIKKVVARYQGLVTLGQLMDMLLHQSRQPLSKIVNESVLGREDIEALDFKSNKLLEKLHSRLTKIEAQGGVLHGVIKRVEPFGGRKRGRPAQLYLEKVIHDSFDIFTEILKKLNVSVSIPDSQTLVKIDPAELQEVIVNLIQNSLHWIQNVDKDNRNISVEVDRTSEGYVEIVFADSGPGVPVENREHIFEPYFSTRKDGFGIGLSISGDIIGEYYGGALELLEGHPLGGAAFKITLKKRV